MTRIVQTFADQPLAHILEVETVDLDNLSLGYCLFGHEDSRVITLMIGDQRWTRSRAAMKAMFTRLLEDIDKVPAQK